jgi:type VI secretion system protein ImpH
MQVNFIGLTGPLGVLPLFYTLLAEERARAHDGAMVDFLDIFNHRFVSLFYRAWERYRFPVSYERDGSDRLTHHLLDLLGLGTAGVRRRLPVPDETLLAYAGLLAPAQRPAEALRQLLAEYFGVPVEVEQFVGDWYPLAESTRCSLGDERGDSARLGRGAVVGDEVWDQQARVRIRIGPLARRDYERFLPTGCTYESLRALVHLFDGQLDFECQLVMARDEVPACEVGVDAEPAPALGWTTWLRASSFARDPDETVLSL